MGNEAVFWNKEISLLEQGDQGADAEQQPHAALAISLDVASFEKLCRSPHLHYEGWLRCTYATGVAISAFPLDAKMCTETEAP